MKKRFPFGHRIAVGMFNEAGFYTKKMFIGAGR